MEDEKKAGSQGDQRKPIPPGYLLKEDDSTNYLQRLIKHSARLQRQLDMQQKERNYLIELDVKDRAAICRLYALLGGGEILDDSQVTL